MNLVQISDGVRRRVALVDEPHLIPLARFDSVYALVSEALRSGKPVASLAERGRDRLDYEEVWAGRSTWRLLSPADVPANPHCVLISGTGLTHLASVQRRDAMHTAASAGSETDSMRMYRWGVEGGKPEGGGPGTAPEWFYKGSGSVLRGHRDQLVVPVHGEDGGEEPEIAGVYLIAPNGTPVRIGFAQGNEFSDHKFERRNYLYLAHSKLRTCSLGPELVTDGAFDDVRGRVAVERDGVELWGSEIRTGEANMCHSLANMEHHHFKYEQHRLPGDLHIHFFGADAFSFGSGVELQDGDWMQVAFEGFGRPLRNTVARRQGACAMTAVQSLV
ncbi:MAG: AraD1 family protein [Bryobacteraceae bacterium]|nr:AraD1 family protein [Bryobacteraceae bacterium]